MEDEVFNYLDFEDLRKRRENYLKDNPDLLYLMNKSPMGGYDITIARKDCIETIHIEKDKE